MSESTSGGVDDPDADPGNLHPADLRDVESVDSVREDTGAEGDTDADPDTLR